MDGERLPIGQKEIARAWEELTRYKQGKQALEERIVQDEQYHIMLLRSMMDTM